MSLASAESVKGSARAEGQRPRGRLFRKYVALLVALVAGALIISGGLSTYFSYQREKTALGQIQQEKAVAAAAVIRQFIEEIQTQIGWTTQLSLLPGCRGARAAADRLLSTAAPGARHHRDRVHRRQRQGTAARLAPRHGRGRQPGGSLGRPGRPWRAGNRRVFRPGLLPQGQRALHDPCARGSGKKGDVTIAEINLKFIRDVISGIRVGKEGYAYVVDAEGRLVAHPDLALVLRKTDLSTLPQVADATGAPGSTGATSGRTEIATGLDGRRVLTAHAAIAPLNWQVFVETPLAEAFAPLYTTLLWNAGLLLLGLAIAVLASLFLARNLVGPIRALQDGRHPHRSGRSESRIDVHDRRRAAVAGRALQSNGGAAAGVLREPRGQGRGADAPAAALGEGAGDARRGQPGDQLDPGAADGACARSPPMRWRSPRRMPASFCAYDEGAQVFRLQATHELDPDVVEALTRRPMRLGEGATGLAGLRRAAVQIPDIDQEAGYALYDIIRKPGYRALLARAVAARGQPGRRAGDLPEDAGRLYLRDGRSGADAGQPVGAGDPERPPVRGARAEGPGACGRQPAQVRVPGQHEPRAPHAAERDHRHRRDAARRTPRTTARTSWSSRSGASTAPATICCI